MSRGAGSGQRRAIQLDTASSALGISDGSSRTAGHTWSSSDRLTAIPSITFAALHPALVQITWSASRMRRTCGGRRGCRHIAHRDTPTTIRSNGEARESATRARLSVNQLNGHDNATNHLLAPAGTRGRLRHQGCASVARAAVNARQSDGRGAKAGNEAYSCIPELAARP